MHANQFNKIINLIADAKLYGVTVCSSYSDKGKLHILVKRGKIMKLFEDTRQVEGFIEGLAAKEVD